MAYDEPTAARVRRLLAGRRDVAEKKLMGGLCFMAAGSMCCSVSGKGGLLVRVIPETLEAMLAEAHARPADIGGRRMTGFVRVASDGYRTEAALKKWVERGLAAATARPAAASKRKRPAAIKAKSAKPGK
jgi:hypothetical protein